MLRLLVLGNGFDLAHGYPTRYIDFLSFCYILSGESKSIECLKPSNQVKKVIEIFNKNNYGRDKIITMIKGNLWIKHFINQLDNLDDTWIDFEREIQECCKKSVKNDDNDPVLEFFEWGPLTHDIELMKANFKDLIFLIKTYIKIVMDLPTNLYYKEILDFDPNMIINFNYTRTFQKFYLNNIETDYIHGVADSNATNNIVLGFNTMNDKNTDIKYAEFLKYFQMVENENTTDVFNKYLDLHGEQRIVIFFGHSLDSTDEDIVKNVILSSDTVYILWHDEVGRNRSIKNLIDIFGKQTFMSLCLTSQRRIVFVKQNDPILTDTAFNLYKQFKSLNSKDKLLKVLNEDIKDAPFRSLCDCVAASDRLPILGFSPENSKKIMEKIKNNLVKIKPNSFIKSGDINDAVKTIDNRLRFYR